MLGFLAKIEKNEFVMRFFPLVVRNSNTSQELSRRNGYWQWDTYIYTVGYLVVKNNVTQVDGPHQTELEIILVSDVTQVQ